jgi:CRP-like cAMP-binding protein
VADKMELTDYKAGDIVFRQGDPGDNFYLIRSGEAEVIIRDDKGENVAVTLDEGSFFGEKALMTGEPRNATIRAKTSLTLCSLDKDEFHQTMEASATFKEELRKVLFERQM